MLKIFKENLISQLFLACFFFVSSFPHLSAFLDSANIFFS